jgi:Trk K+ transport system NAD-binding subunit
MECTTRSLFPHRHTETTGWLPVDFPAPRSSPTSGGLHGNKDKLVHRVASITISPLSVKPTRDCNAWLENLESAGHPNADRMGLAPQQRFTGIYPKGQAMRQTIVLCGLGRVGWRILESLRSTGASVTVVEIKINEDDPRLKGVTVVRGDCRQAEVLQRANIQAASGVLVVTSDDLVNLSTAMSIRKINPDVRIVLRMFNQNFITRLGKVLKNTVALSVSALTAPLMALAAVSGESLAAFSIGTKPQQFSEIIVTPASPILGEPIGQVAARFRLLPIALKPTAGPLQLWDEISGETILADGDRLVLCGSPHDLNAVLSGVVAGSAVRWAGGVRRFFRTLRRTITLIDLPVRLASVLLFISLFASTLVFRFGVGATWAESLYQTVSVAATGADLHGEDKPGWVKVFLSVLKLIGAALIAVFTAVFTNYLLKARLRGAFEERRIPDGGHVVVCGLGNIGYRCVQELLRLDVQVVAVDRVGDKPFVAAVRQLGAAVVIGDATLSEVLDQARFGTARAVIAATASELVNLEIALIVRERNPSQRVVVRISDPDFAQAARDAADIRFALAPPVLAAPAFATALLGDRVQALASIGDRTIAVVELIADQGDELCDRTVHELMIDYRFIPLCVQDGEPSPVAGLNHTHRMLVGHRLIVAIEMSDLERMLRQEAPPAVWSVQILEYPLSARSELETLVRTSRGCTEVEAQTVVQSERVLVLERVSRGRAEELAARLERERMTVQIIPSGS